MNLGSLFLKELRFRRISFLLAVFASALVAGSISHSRLSLRSHDLETERMLEELNQRSNERMAGLRDDARVFAKSLGFNILILPAGQDAVAFHVENRSTHFFEENTVGELADSDPVFLNHLLPVLRHRIHWDSYGGEVVLLGIKGQIYIKNPGWQAPIQKEISPGRVDLGHGIARKIGLKPGDTIQLMGDTFRIDRILSQQGTIEDSSILMNLGDLQQLLKLEGKIGGIFALSCNCEAGNTRLIAESIHPILPGAQVIESGRPARARAAAREAVGQRTKEQMEDLVANREQLRRDREGLARKTVVAVAATALLLLGTLSFLNVHERRGEIAILRAIGVKRVPILKLFLSKPILAALIGGWIGVGIGYLLNDPAGLRFTHELVLAATSVLSTILVGIASGLFPALQASGIDPAPVLNQE